MWTTEQGEESPKCNNVIVIEMEINIVAVVVLVFALILVIFPSSSWKARHKRTAQNLYDFSESTVTRARRTSLASGQFDQDPREVAQKKIVLNGVRT